MATAYDDAVVYTDNAGGYSLFAFIDGEPVRYDHFAPGETEECADDFVDTAWNLDGASTGHEYDDPAEAAEEYDYVTERLDGGGFELVIGRDDFDVFANDFRPKTLDLDPGGNHAAKELYYRLFHEEAEEERMNDPSGYEPYPWEE